MDVYIVVAVTSDWEEYCETVVSVHFDPEIAKAKWIALHAEGAFLNKSAKSGWSWKPSASAGYVIQKWTEDGEVEDWWTYTGEEFSDWIIAQLLEEQ